MPRYEFGTAPRRSATSCFRALVQVGALSIPCRDRSARRFAGVRARIAPRCRDTSLGQHRGDPLPRASELWYKSAPYRSRAVIDPRGVLREFGLELPQDAEIRVWDSTAEIRYLVLPSSGTSRRLIDPVP